MLTQPVAQHDFFDSDFHHAHCTLHSPNSHRYCLSSNGGVGASNYIYCTCYLLAYRCTKHPVLINAHSAGSDISPLSLVVRYCCIVVINLMRQWTLYTYCLDYCLYSLWNCTAGSRSFLGGNNIIRSKLSSGVLLSRVPS